MDDSSFVADERYEYQDLVVPLNVRLEGDENPTAEQLAAFRGWDGVVTAYLGVAGRDGWRADERADWDALEAADRFEKDLILPSEADPNAPTLTIYQSVTIRLKRLRSRV
jgi:hypothetical protein